MRRTADRLMTLSTSQGPMNLGASQPVEGEIPGGEPNLLAGTIIQGTRCSSARRQLRWAVHERATLVYLQMGWQRRRWVRSEGAVT